MALTTQELADLAECGGPHRTILAGAIGELFLANPAAEIVAGKSSDIAAQFPDILVSRDEWVPTGVRGAVIFVVDREMDTFLFQIFDLDGLVLRFQFEAYEDLEYQKLEPHFHAFELDDCVAGLNFSDEKAAKHFSNKVIGILSNSTTTQANEITNANNMDIVLEASESLPTRRRGLATLSRSPPLATQSVGEQKMVSCSSPRPASPPVSPPTRPASSPSSPSSSSSIRTSVISSLFTMRATAKARKSKKHMSAAKTSKDDDLMFAQYAKSEAKAETMVFQVSPLAQGKPTPRPLVDAENAGPKDIGAATNVVRTGHVGVNADGSLDLSEIPAEWKHLFRQAGLRKSDLSDPHVKDRIRDAMASAGIKTRSRTITRTYSRNLHEDELCDAPRRPSISRKFMAEQIRLQQQREQVHLAEEKSSDAETIAHQAARATISNAVLKEEERESLQPLKKGAGAAAAAAAAAASRRSRKASRGASQKRSPKNRDVDRSVTESKTDSVEGDTLNLSDETVTEILVCKPATPTRASHLAVLREIEDRRGRRRGSKAAKEKEKEKAKKKAKGREMEAKIKEKEQAARTQKSASPRTITKAKAQQSSPESAADEHEQQRREAKKSQRSSTKEPGNTKEPKPMAGFLGAISQGDFKLRKVSVNEKDEAEKKKKEREDRRPAFLREIETGVVSLRRLSEVEALPELDDKSSGVQDSLLSILKTCVLERRDHVRQDEADATSVNGDEWSDDGWD